MAPPHTPETCPAAAELRATLAERLRVEAEFRDDLRRHATVTGRLEVAVAKLDAKLDAVPLQAAAVVAPVERHVDAAERTARDSWRVLRAVASTLLPLVMAIIALVALLSRSPEPSRPEPPPAAAAPATAPITAAAPPADPGRSP